MRTATTATFTGKSFSIRNYRTDLDGVTESGYLRLIALAVRAYNEYPDSSAVVHVAFGVLLAINQSILLTIL